jgi:hypothetical protein
MGSRAGARGGAGGKGGAVAAGPLCWWLVASRADVGWGRRPGHARLRTRACRSSWRLSALQSGRVGSSCRGRSRSSATRSVQPPRPDKQGSWVLAERKR